MTTTMTMTTEPGGVGASSTQRSRWYVALATGIAVLGADAATKAWATTRLDHDPISWFGGFVRLIHSRNPGAAFGVGTSLTPLFATAALVATLVLLYAAGRARSTPAAVLIGLLLGGAGGNLFDRLFRAPSPLHGHVVDWIDVGSWPTFNLADTSLVIGALGLAVWMSRTAE